MARYPFNVEMNINHEYWHPRENDPNAVPTGNLSGPSRLDIKFSFANCLDEANEIKLAPPFGYVPEIEFRTLVGWTIYPDRVSRLWQLGTKAMRRFLQC
jgi:hypothetical protein